MKLRSKKILALSLTSLVGLSTITPITANAAIIEYRYDINDPINGGNGYTKLSGNYSQGIRLKLRSRQNSLYKDWWQVNLQVVNGKLQLTGPTNIPENLTFDDNFSINVFGKDGSLKARYKFEYKKSASEELKTIMDSFNKNAPTYKDCYITVVGRDWDGTVRFDSKLNAIIQKTNNNYANGYNKINRFNYAFKITDKGLEEVPFNWSW